MRRRRLALGCGLGAVIALGACVSSRSPTLYVLRAPGDGAAGVPASPTGPRLQLQRVIVPDYLDTTDLLERDGLHAVRSSPSGRWAERLSGAIADAITAELTRQLPDTLIESGGATDVSAAHLVLTVSVFDVWSDGRCRLVASWRIRSTNPVADRIGSATIDQPAAMAGVAAGDGVVVESMAAVVRTLGGRIAAAIAPP